MVWVKEFLFLLKNLAFIKPKKFKDLNGASILNKINIRVSNLKITFSKNLNKKFDENKYFLFLDSMICGVTNKLSKEFFILKESKSLFAAIAAPPLL